MESKELKSCICCGSNKLYNIINLGNQPFADMFLTKEQIGLDYKTPLICNLCIECGNIQLKYITNSKIRYNLVDYSYTSSNSDFAKNHWNEFSNKLEFLNNKSFIIEIGSNDGYLLSSIKNNYNSKVLGIDASKYMCDLCNRNNIEAINSIFTYQESINVVKKYGKCDLVIANNVLNHSNNTIDFINGIYNLLCDKGQFIFELPYWGESIKTNKIDQIYHEHITYLTVKSAYNILKKCKLYIKSVEFVNYHGVSLRILSSKDNNYEDTNLIKNLINKENQEKLFNIDFYKEYMINYSNSKLKILNEILKYKKQNKKIIAVGAAAKANTFLNYINLDNTIINYLTDTSEHKIGKYSPGTNILIVPDDIIKDMNNPIIIILSWNISHILKPKLNKLNDNITYIDIDRFFNK